LIYMKKDGRMTALDVNKC